MASSRDTRNGPDVRDVAAVMVAFEAINQVRLVIRLVTEEVKNTSVLRMEAEAWDRIQPNTEAQLLASTSVRCGWSDPRTVDAAIMQLTYKLDSMLAAGEFFKLTRQ